jgi:hypothetical protein
MNELLISMEKFTANFTAIPAGCLLASTLQHTGPLVTVTHTSTGKTCLLGSEAQPPPPPPTKKIK